MPFRSSPEALHQREEQLIVELEELDQRSKQAAAELERVRRALTDPDDPLLTRLAIASPCDARWEHMEGDERTRHCHRCDKRVNNVAALTRRELRELFATHREPCVRLRRRGDGTLITGDCPQGARRRQRGRTTAAALVAGAGISIAISSVVTTTMGGVGPPADRQRSRFATPSVDVPTVAPETIDRIAETFGSGEERFDPEAYQPTVALGSTNDMPDWQEREIKRSTLDFMLSNHKQLSAMGNGLRLEHPPGGQAYLTVTVAPGSLFERLGLETGDRLVGLNNRRLDDPESAMKAYETLHPAPARMLLELRRDDRRVLISYDVVD